MTYHIHSIRNGFVVKAMLFDGSGNLKEAEWYAESVVGVTKLLNEIMYTGENIFNDDD